MEYILRGKKKNLIFGLKMGVLRKWVFIKRWAYLEFPLKLTGDGV